MKYKFVAIFMFTAVFSITYLSIDLVNNNIFESLEENTSVSENNIENEYRYRVSVFNGKLAVFDRDSKLPYKVYDTYISSLPEEDRKIIEEGIFTNSSSELMKIIEDYTS